MVLGTGSNVGKSLVVAGLCRLFANRGLIVRPFKPQNMSNNAAATPDGGEIGRAQALQARAARTAPSVHMNPVLLKPESETGSQVIVQGQRWATLKARDYGRRKSELLPAVLDSYTRVGQGADLIIVEGAGSPAEVNLRDGDIANMGFAQAANIPAVLVGDIDRGGVIASLVGCHAVLEPAERDRIKAFIINRFRGDVSLFDEGLAIISRRTGWQSLGVIPFFAKAHRLPAEDSSDLDSRRAHNTASANCANQIKIVALRLPRIANFDDLDPLRLEPGVTLELLTPETPIPADADLVILPGSKTTVADMGALIAAGWDIDLKAHVRRGGAVLGICGGYQMLGRTIHDPDGLEGAPGTVQGLGLLDVETTLTPDKTVRPSRCIDPVSGAAYAGYEIHLGTTTGPDCARPYAHVSGHPDGAVSADGRVSGTYVHGGFADDLYRRLFLQRLGQSDGARLTYDALIEETLDEVAEHIAQSIDITALADIAGLPRSPSDFSGSA